MAQIIENNEGASYGQNDIIIWDGNSEELQQQAGKVFESIRKHGLKLNKSNTSLINHKSYFKVIRSQKKEYTQITIKSMRYRKRHILET